MALYTAARTCNTEESLVLWKYSPPSVSLHITIVTVSHTHAHAVCKKKKKKEPHLLSDVLATFQVMISIRQNLWLYDRHDAMLAKKGEIIRII